eukprot:TRINITY_DN105580_c0_g1_i1.p1 TRINITY_DN105580_c0_g1~~TRINITY_DN105580_c0_g1_i1.p1  ORF type:complete len:632 (+),score=104.43 TRINITY_DN105580_c0_g1_i1:123-1898(+)
MSAAPVATPAATSAAPSALLSLPTCADDDAKLQATFAVTETCAEWKSECATPSVLAACCATCKTIQQGSAVIWNAQSKSTDKTLSSTFYTAFYAGSPSETGQPYDIGFDTHLMHGTSAPDGSLIGVGFSLEQEVQGANRDITIIRADGRNGSMLGHWKSKWTGDDVAVAAAIFEGDLLVAGFSRPSTAAASKRTLIKIKLSDLKVGGTPLWTATIGDASSITHSSYEGIAVSSTGVWLGGCKDNANGNEFTFKSSGNIPEGTAFASFISSAKLKQATAPTAEDFIWSDPSWTSVKALDLTVENSKQYVIAGLHKDHQGHPLGALVKLEDKGTLSTKVWGPTVYDSQTEVTDVAVAPDGSGYIVTGHGSVAHLKSATAPAEYYGRFTRVDTTGKKLWTVNISVGKPSIIYTECFAVQPIGWSDTSTQDAGWIGACGTGIEGESLCNTLSGTDKANCLAGIGDYTTPGAPARKPGVWMANIPTIPDSKTETPPKVSSMLLTSYLGEGQVPGPSGSTGAEFIVPTTDGGFYVTTDEEFGAGFFKLGASSAALISSNITEATRTMHTKPTRSRKNTFLGTSLLQSAKQASRSAEL